MKNFTIFFKNGKAKVKQAYDLNCLYQKLRDLGVVSSISFVESNIVRKNYQFKKGKWVKKS